VKGSGGEERGREESRGLSGAASDEDCKNGDRRRSPENGRELSCPVGGPENFDPTGDQVVERRVDASNLSDFQKKAQSPRIQKP
jgi:hypothetical protein